MEPEQHDSDPTEFLISEELLALFIRKSTDNEHKALVKALRMAVSAPTEILKEQCIMIASDIARNFDKDAVNRAKDEAELIGRIESGIN
jgi:hypothetical protein